MTEFEEVLKTILEEYARRDTEGDFDTWEETDSFVKEKAEVLLAYANLKEEPVSVWHDKDEEPDEDRQVLINLSGFCYVDFYHKEDKRFYMFGKPKHYLCEVDKWAYIGDILNLSNIKRTVKNWKEPVSEELEEELPKVWDRETLDEYAYQVAYDLSNDWLKETATWDDVETAVKLGAKWQLNQIRKKNE